MHEAAPNSPLSLLAIVANAPTPYRTHFHQRVSDEIQELRLISLFTHEVSNAPWASTMPDSIRPVMLGKGELTSASGLTAILREWGKGAKVIRELATPSAGGAVKAVIINGYADLGRVRTILWCKRHRIPCFIWGDSNILGDSPGGLKQLVKRTVLRWILRRATGALCCGRLGQAYFERYGVPANRIFWVPCEPDYRLIANSPHTTAAHLPIVLDPSRRRIIYSGRLASVKRVDLLIEAFTQIASERPEWDLLVVGDGDERERLKSLVPKSLQDRVLWTGFLDDQAVISAMYRASDVLVLPSDFEPWALVVNEAIAAGLAVVASNVVGAAAELVVEDVNGAIFTAGDSALLTAKLRLVTAPQTIDRLKANSALILQRWRDKADPVEGVRQALQVAGVLSVHEPIPATAGTP